MPSTLVDVYLAGAKRNGTDTAWTATYWKNGAAVPLTNGLENSYLFGIVVSGTDVYAAGYEGTSLKYWKNGISFSLGDTAHASALAVAGSDVYLAGAMKMGSVDSACYWKNRTRFSLQTPSSPGATLATSIAVNGKDVYVAGFQAGIDSPTALLWKNNQIVTSAPGVINSITVTASSFYMAGYSGQNTSLIPVYWNNNTEVPLPGNIPSKANYVVTSGADVYIAGYQTDNGNKVAMYWKNGTPVVLSGGARPQQAYAIVVVSNDVYVTSDGKLPHSSILWKNGTPVAPFDGTDSTYYAFALCAVKK